MKRNFLFTCFMLCTIILYGQENEKNHYFDLKLSLPIGETLYGYGGEGTLYSENGFRGNIGFSFIRQEHMWTENGGTTSVEEWGMPLIFGDVGFCMVNDNDFKSYIGFGLASQTINYFHISGEQSVVLRYDVTTPYVDIGISKQLFKILVIEATYINYLDWFNDLIGSNYGFSHFTINSIADTHELRKILGVIKISMGIRL